MQSLVLSSYHSACVCVCVCALKFFDAGNGKMCPLAVLDS